MMLLKLYQKVLLNLGKWKIDLKQWWQINLIYGFAVDWMRKDLKIAMEEAKRNGSPVPITTIIDEYYAEVQKMGGNRWDSSSLIALLKKKNNKCNAVVLRRF